MLGVEELSEPGGASVADLLGPPCSTDGLLSTCPVRWVPVGGVAEPKAPSTSSLRCGNDSGSALVGLSAVCFSSAYGVRVEKSETGCVNAILQGWVERAQDEQAHTLHRDHIGYMDTVCTRHEWRLPLPHRLHTIQVYAYLRA